MIKALSIVLEDGCNLHYDLDFSDQGTLRITNPVVLGKNSGWLALDFCKCPDCNLENQTSPNCPVAEVLAQYACDLADRQSFEKVKVHIIQEDNRELILRDVQLQTVVGELVRLAVFQSHCPVGRRIKSAVAKLPPFPRSQELLQALAIFFALQASLSPGKSTKSEQVKYVQSLHGVFGNLCRRLEKAGNGDAYLNGVVVLHSLSLLFSLTVPELVEAALGECRAW